MNLVNANVLITGGGSGIGLHLVTRLAETVARIAVLERDSEACAALNAELPEKVIAVQCDVTDAEAVKAALQQVFDSGFEPDVLVNNAGMI